MVSTFRRTIRPAARWIVATLVALTLTAAPRGAVAQEEHEHGDGHTHEHGDHGHGGLHFTHPLIAESVTPDRKLRFDHQFFDFPDGDTEHSGLLEAEHAFHRSFSVEVGLPYSYSAGEFGNLEAKLKFANFAFEDAGVLLGYGVGVVFPTNGTPDVEGPRGSASRASLRTSRAASPPPPRFSGGGAGVEGTLGSDEWELEPFLNVGFRQGRWELVGWTIFGIPFAQEEQAEVATEISWSLSTLFHASSRLQALLELDGSGGVSGEPVGEDVVFASPGLRVQPFPGRPLWVGTTVGFPLATGVEEDPFDVRWKTSLFWHFPM